MGKIGIEICLISARGLRRSSSLWKLHWFAVGWIDPKTKYCTKIDTSGSTNPSWRTKFSAMVDDDSESQGPLTLHVEVYSRDAIFLREKLQGTAVVVLKEFLAKSGVEQVGSFQLRKKSSGRAHGFVDVSIQISDSTSTYPGDAQGFQLTGEGNGIPLGVGNGSYSSQQPPSYPYQQMTSAYDPQSSVGGQSYRPPPTPPPPAPPSHVGYIPTFLPSTGQLPGNYVNIPSSSSTAGRRGAPNFGMGAGAGALAAGAVIFGDDFMSGFELPSTLQDDSLVISTDPPF